MGAASGGIIAGGVAGISGGRGVNPLKEGSIFDDKARRTAIEARIQAENRAFKAQNEGVVGKGGENATLSTGTGDSKGIVNREATTTAPEKRTKLGDYGEKYFYEEGQRLVEEEAEKRGMIDFLPGVQTYYTAGVTGLMEKDIRQTVETARGDKELLNRAYIAGANDGKADLAARMKGMGKMGQKAGVILRTEAANEEQKAFANLMATTGGMEVVLVDSLPQDANGSYKRGQGQITIALNSDSFTGTLFHESTHYIKEANPVGYDRMQKAVFEIAAGLEGLSIEKYTEKYDRAYRGIYEERGQAVKIGDILEEMTGDAFQKIAADESSLRGFLGKMQKEDPTLLERVKEFIDKLLVSLKGLVKDVRFSSFAKEINKDINATERLQDIFIQELKGAGRLQRGEDVGGRGSVEDENISFLPHGEVDGRMEEVAFSIRYTEDNTPFVVVVEDILEGVEKEDWVKAVVQNLKEKFPNGVRVGSDVVRIDASSRREMTHSRYMKALYRSDEQKYHDKLQATNQADEILQASRNYVGEGLKHPRKDNIQEFARGTVLLRIGENGYSADVVVGTKRNGEMLLYDFIKMRSVEILEKKKTQNNTRKNQEIQSGRPSVPFEKSIAQRKAEINDKEGTEDIKFSLREPFEEQVDAVLDDTRIFKDSHVYVRDTPKVLTDLGLRQLPMLMTAKHVYTTAKASGKYKNVNYHDLGEETIKQIPDALEEPVVVMRSATKESSLVVVVDMIDNQNRPIIVAVYMDGEGYYSNINIESNVLTSLYGKDGFYQFMQDALKENRILYLDKQKSRTFAKIPRVQFPSNLYKSDFTYNISRFKEYVKRNRAFKGISEDTKFSLREPFEEQVDLILDDSKQFETSHVYVRDTPKVLTDLGLRQLPMLMTAKHVYTTAKASGKYKNANYHDLGEGIIKQIPDALEEPVVVMRSATKESSLVVVVDMVDNQNRPMIVAVHMDGKGNYEDIEIDSNILTSTYGKDGFYHFMQDALKENRILYLDKQKSRTFAKTPGVQFPNNLYEADFTHNISQFKEYVKRNRAFKGISEDTKFSLREESYEDLLKENERLRDLNEALKRQFKITKEVAHDPASARKVVKAWLKKNQSSYDVGVFTEKYLELCNYVAGAGNEVDLMGVMAALQNMAEEALNVSKVLNTELRDRYIDLIQKIKGTTIKVNPALWAELEYYGGYNQIRKENFGRMRLSTQEGVSIGNLYTELGESYPALFAEEKVASSSEQMMHLISVLDSLKPEIENPYGYDMSGYALDAAYDLWDMYFEVQMQKPTFRDKENQKVAKMRAGYKREMALMRETAKGEKQEALLYQKRKIETREAERRAKERERSKEAWKKARREHRGETQEVKEKTWARAAAHFEGRLDRQGNAYKKRLARQEEYYGGRIDRQEDYFKKRLDRKEIYFREKIARREAYYKKLRDGREYAKYRRRVEIDAKALVKWINTPTDKYHVPKWMLEKVVTVLSKIESTDPDTVLQLKDFEGMGQEIERLTREESSETYIEPDDMIAIILKDFKETFPDGARLVDLTAEQMKDLSTIVRSLKQTVTAANRILSSARGAKVSTVAEEFIARADKVRAARQDGIMRTALDFFNIYMVDAFSFFKGMGESVYVNIFQGFTEGFNRKVRHVEQGMAYLSKVVDKKTIQKWRGEAAQEFAIGNGKINLTIPQIMSLYCLNRRPAGARHIAGGGIKADPKVKAKAKDKAQAHALLEAYGAVQPTEAELAQILDTLTEEQKEVAEQIQRFFSTEIAKWGNETSMALFGYEKFLDPQYFPIVSDENYINVMYGDANGGRSGTLQSMGMTKGVSKFAKNPLILQDIFSVFSSHTDQMSSYNAYVLPLSDLSKLLNYKRLPQKGDGENINPVASVRQSMEKVMGQKGIQYVKRFMERMNGVAQREDMEELPRMMIRNMKIASVWANLRVIVQQPTSYIRAADMISPKYLTAAMAAGKNDFDIIHKYAPITQWKEWGFYENSIGPGMEALIVGKGFYEKHIVDKAMYFAGAADKLTWGRLWKAVELETKKTHPELTGERFYTHVGERLSGIINETQVVDSILHRSMIMNSKSVFSQMATSFMSEPTKIYNMLRSSVVEMIQEDTKENRNRVARTVATLIISGIATAGAAALVDMLRDDDEDEALYEKWLQAFRGDYSEAETPTDYIIGVIGSNLNDSFNPMSYIPYLRDLLSTIQGFTVQRTDFSWVADITKMSNKWMKYAEGNSPYTLNALLLDSVAALSKMTGVPINSMKRDLFAIKDTVINQFMGEEAQYANSKLTYAIGAEKNAALYARKMLEAKLSGNTAFATEIYNDMVKQGVGSETIESRLDSQEVERIGKEALLGTAVAAFATKDFGKYMEELQKLRDKGYKQKNIEGAVKKRYKELYEEEAAESFEMIQEEFWTEEDEMESEYFDTLFEGLTEAKLSGKKGLATKIYNEMIGAGLSNEKINSKIESKEKALIKEEPLATEAAKAYHEGDYDKYSSATESLEEKNYFSGNIKSAVKSVYTKLYGEEEEDSFETITQEYWEDEEEDETTDYELLYELLYNAFMNGSNGNYRKMWQDLRRKGKEDSSIKTSMRNRLKKEYQDAKAAGDREQAEKAKAEFISLGGRPSTLQKEDEK